MLTARRVVRPYGIASGEPVMADDNLYIKREEDGTQRIIKIGGKLGHRLASLIVFFDIVEVTGSSGRQLTTSIAWPPCFPGKIGALHFLLVVLETRTYRAMYIEKVPTSTEEVCTKNHITAALPI
jgi:hypothetical protein